MGSVYARPKEVAIGVGKGTIRKHGDGHHVFFHRDRVVEIAFAVQEMLQPSNLMVSNFLLRLKFGLKHNVIFLPIAHDWNRALA